LAVLAGIDGDNMSEAWITPGGSFAVSLEDAINLKVQNPSLVLMQMTDDDFQRIVLENYQGECVD
jgi:hypothetical protein